MGLTKCDISLDDVRYYPGQTINGRVDYTFAEPKTINGISIKFKGVAEVSWTTTESRRNANGKNTSHTVYHTANEEYLNLSYDLCGGKGTEITLPAGSHSFPISCVLPINLPTTFEGIHGFVRYIVKAKLDRPWKLNKVTETHFTVAGHLDLNMIPQAQLTANAHVEKKFGCCCCTSGPLRVDVGIPISGFCPNQLIPFEIGVENASNVNVLYIELILRKVITFRCYTPRNESKTTHEEVAKITTNGIMAHSESNFAIKLEVPQIFPFNMTYCNIIDLNYEIKIVVHNAGWHFNMHANFPVYIGTVPLMGYLGAPSNTVPALPYNNQIPSVPLMEYSQPPLNSDATSPYKNQFAPLPQMGYSQPPPISPYNNQFEPPPPYPQCMPGSMYVNPQPSYSTIPSAPTKDEYAGNVPSALVHHSQFGEESKPTNDDTNKPTDDNKNNAMPYGFRYQVDK